MIIECLCLVSLSEVALRLVLILARAHLLFRHLGVSSRLLTLDPSTLIARMALFLKRNWRPFTSVKTWVFWSMRWLLFFMSISEQCRGRMSRSSCFMKRSCHIGCLSFTNVPLKEGQFLSMANCVSKLSTCGEKNEKQLAFLVSKGQILIVLLRMQLFIAFQSLGWS